MSIKWTLGTGITTCKKSVTKKYFRTSYNVLLCLFLWCISGALHSWFTLYASIKLFENPPKSNINPSCKLCLCSLCHCYQ
jgi:hypothetical protein